MKPQDVVVTTGDIKTDYDIIGPLFYQVSNKGVFSSALAKLKKAYREELEQIRRTGQTGQLRADWGFLVGESSVGQNDFDAAFFISVQELKKRAAALGADAVVGMRQDIDLDTTAFQYFYLQMYGTAVRYRPGAM